MKTQKPILVTKPYLPSIKEVNKYIRKIWKNEWLTNNGPMVRELEEKLKEYLGVKHLFYVTNGTVAIQLAIKALELKGEVITTPFTYVATTNSFLWEGCTPVFVDIDPETFCIDPELIEQSITEKTTAILAVHVYGNPVNVARIEEIAKKHNLRVIYDAAHCFGTKIDGNSVLNFGDVSTLSFHATKLFHTIEGGAIITADDAVAKKLSLLRSFGHVGEEHFSIGINGKNSELHAAVGLINLPKVKRIVRRRKQIANVYFENLNTDRIKTLSVPDSVEFNHAYYPVVFESERALLAAKSLLEENNVFPRRYFYPSLNLLNFVEYQRCPVSESVSKRTLCLPLYESLPLEDAKRIALITSKAIEEVPSFNKPTLTIGIPAHNEGANIEYLLRSILKQHQDSYQIEEIIVAADNCTDDTEAKVRNFERKYPFVKLISGRTRKGKPTRLNQIYSRNKSDYILNLDADIVLVGADEIENMFKLFKTDPNITTVAGHMEPVSPKGLIPQILHTNHILWNETRVSINQGDHIANLFGSSTMITKDFSKKIKYPDNITADEEYLYVMSKLYGKFRYAKDTKFLYRAASSLEELRLQGTRFLTERNGLKQYFGEDIVNLHNIPLKNKALAVLKMMVKRPIYTPLAIILNLWIRKFPVRDNLNDDGMWQMVQSTKMGIATE